MKNKIPGFTAETSLAPAQYNYAKGGNFALMKMAGVAPQQECSMLFFKQRCSVKCNTGQKPNCDGELIKPRQDGNGCLNAFALNEDDKLIPDGLMLPNSHSAKRVLLRGLEEFGLVFSVFTGFCIETAICVAVDSENNFSRIIRKGECL